MQDTASAGGAPPDDQRSRRRLLGAGLAGLATSLLPQFTGRVRASATTTTDPADPDDAGPEDTRDAPTGGNPSGGESEDTAVRPSGPLATDSPDTTNATGGVDAPEDTTTPGTGDERPPGTDQQPVVTDVEVGDTGGPDDGATTTSAPPDRPTAEDVGLLQFVQSVELGIVSLYDRALGAAGDQGASLLVTMREAHQAYGQNIGALIGSTDAEASSDVIDAFGAGFDASGNELLTAAYDLESAALATHQDLVGRLVGVDGAALVASILMAGARHCTILAHASGATDLDTLLLSDATSMAPTEG